MAQHYLTNPLESKFIRDDFECGQDALDGYLKKQASQDVKRKLSACFVLANQDNVVQGYYTLSSSSIPRSLLPLSIVKKLPPSYKDLPVTLLGRLAIDNACKGKGLGGMLLVDALKRAYKASMESVASMAVVVDPIDQQAIHFYAKFGFILLPDSRKMFLPMNTIALLF